MAAHAALLHNDDWHTLTRLARPGCVDGRRGQDSLYGILVRAVYHALVHFLLNAPHAPTHTPDSFPTGKGFKSIAWVTDSLRTPYDSLCLGEALAVAGRWGDDAHVGGAFPILAGDVLRLAPGMTRVPSRTPFGETPHTISWQRKPSRRNTTMPAIPLTGILCVASRFSG